MTRLLALLALLAPAADDGLVAVRTARVHTGAGETIEGAVIVLRDGKIVEIRRDGQVPAGATLVDASRQVVVPGLIDAHTALADEGRDGDATVAQDVRAVDGMDFFASARRTLAGGVTTVYVSPGSKRLLSGQGAVVKTAGTDPRGRVLRETWGLAITLGEPSKNPPTVFEPPVRATPDDPIRPARRQYPASRMGQFAELRRAAAGPGPLRDRRPTLVVSAHEADDLVKAVLLAEELGTKIVLVDAEEAPAVADFLAPRRIPVVLNPGFAPGHREAVPAADPRGRPDGVAALLRAGVRVALHAPDDADLRELLFIAAAAVRQGLTRDEALACVTRAPAEILGVADRVGTIAPGRDADLVFLSGDLFGARTAVERVMIDGAFVYERTAADVRTYRALPESGPRKEMLAIRGGRVLTATQGVIPDGLVLVEKGKVVYVGRGRPVPEGARIQDASGLTVVPGFVDLGSQLGLGADRTELGLRKAGAEGVPPVFPSSPAGFVDLQDPAFREASRSGVTSVLLVPDAAGACSLVKLSGEPTAVVRETAAVKVAVRGGTGGAQALREHVQRARRYHEEWTAYERAKKEPPKPAEGVAGAWAGTLEGGGARAEATLELKADGTKVSGTLTTGFTGNKAEPVEGTFEKDELRLARKREGLEVELTLKREGDAFKGPWRAVVAGKESKGGSEFRRPVVEPPKEPRRDDLLDPWRKVFTREIPALAVTRDVPAVQAAVKVLRAEADVDLVLVDAGQAAWAGEAVAGRGVGVVLGPDIVREHRGALVNLAEALAAQGIPLAFQSAGSTATRHLALTAAWAVRHGLEPSDALRALTATPARMLRLDGRIGAIERGGDADLVLFDGEPFSPSSRVRVVIIDGKIVHGGD